MRCEENSAMKVTRKFKKFCGNCNHHNLYRYPDLMFCPTRYARQKNPIVETLWCCSEWITLSQKCHCVKEALKAKLRR